jgi:hypothetical protein
MALAAHAANSSTVKADRVIVLVWLCCAVSGWGQSSSSSSSSRHHERASVQVTVASQAIQKLC